MRRAALSVLGVFLLALAGMAAAPFVFADTVNFNDTFTAGADQNLDAHTPDTGTSWTQVINTGTVDLRVVASSDNLQAGDCGLNDGAAYTADATYSGADYYAQVTMTTGDTLDDYNYIGVRVEADGDGYWLRFNNNVILSEDLAQIHKRVAGSWSTVGSPAGSQIANGSVVKFEIIGSALKVYDDGAEIISTTDTSITAAGKAGIGMGDIGAVSGADCSTQVLDNFSVTVIEAAATPAPPSAPKIITIE